MTVTTDEVALDSADALPPGQRIAKKPFKRFLLGQTAYDFWGRRWWGYGISLALMAISVVTLSLNWLNLGIEFEGGIAYDVPATDSFDTDDARSVLDAAGLDGSDAKVEQRRSSSGDFIKIQIEDEPAEVREAVQEALAEQAGVDPADVSVSSVSASWGDEITRKAVMALVVFLGLIAVVIAIRFEWRMAVSAILAMLHDVLVAAGIYSLFGFEVTPPTVIAFLTILGYSLYDTIVVFDRVKDNERRIASAGLTAADLVNVSTNQVLLRSLNTSIAAILPVLSLLVVGAGILGQVTLQGFAIALLIGMLTGAYSSIFLATPLLGWFKGARGGPGAPTWLVGEDLRHVVVRGVGVLAPRGGRRRGRGTTAPRRSGEDATVETPAVAGARPAPTPRPLEASTEQLLSHPPRPRKKKRH
jgi:preprotein translocase subunit SecF